MASRKNKKEPSDAELIEDLHYAIQKGETSVVKQMLIDYGSRIVGLQDDLGQSSMHIACLSDQYEILCQLYGVDNHCLNLQDNHGRTAAHVAAAHNSLRCLEFLAKRGADFNIKNHKGQTVFDVCTSPAGREIVQSTVNTRTHRAERNERSHIIKNAFHKSPKAAPGQGSQHMGGDSAKDAEEYKEQETDNKTSGTSVQVKKKKQDITYSTCSS